MITRLRWLSLLAALALGAGCSAITGFGGLSARGGSDGGMDGGGDPVDGGPEGDGGPDVDGGPSDCDPACAAGESCVEGTCQCGSGPACDTGQGCCGGECRSLDTVEDCGACDNTCAPRINANATCGASGCEYTCVDSFDDCDGDATNGCEQSLLRPEACGACTNACASGELCGTMGGSPACVSTCTSPEVECGSTCYVPGETCRCSAAAAPGGLDCASGTVECGYPAEVCNGEDDDCDGAADEGFDCRLGQNRPCPSGCGSTGTQSCSTSCGWGVCVVTERCTRDDTDCDVFVDEGLLTLGAAFTQAVGTVATPRAAVNPLAMEIGVVFGTGSGARFARLGLDGSAIGTPVLLSSAGTVVDWDVAFDGSDFVVALADRALPGPRVIRVSAAGSVGADRTLVPPGSRPPPRQVRLDWIGTSSEVAVVTTTEAGPGSAAYLHTVELSGAPMTAPLPTADIVLAEEPGSSLRFETPAVVRLDVAALVAWGDRDDDSLFLGEVSPGGIPGATTVLDAGDGLTEAAVELAYDPVTRHIGVSHIKRDGSVLRDGRLTVLDPALTIIRSITVAGGAALQTLHVAAANDATFGLLSRTSAGAVVLTRYRALDAVVDPMTITPSVTYAQHLVGVPAGLNRYLALRGGSDLSTVPYQCVPSP